MCYKHLKLRLFILIITLVPTIIKCQIINKPPNFVHGSGDMSRYSLSENTPVGSPVYQLKGVDPEGGALRYSISGPVFSVDRDTGVVRLRQSLDRETQDIVEVIISLTDEGVLGTEPNTVSLRREIPIRDYNDNSPVFIGRPYSTSVSEATKPGTFIEILPNIIVTDRDEGNNAEIHISCSKDETSDNDDICDIFEVITEKISDGKYGAIIQLKRKLDFETRPSYILTLKARDSATTNQLIAFATIAINVIDIQDQPPVFLNTPYSTNIPENSAEGKSILTIIANDGDTGNPRPILLTLENEKFGHFTLKSIGNPEDGRAILITTDIPLDRENPEILQNGGVYTFTVKATELINNEVPGDTATSQITIVLTDIDDHNPMFNEPEFEIFLPENLEQDTPLPRLSIYVIDEDQGFNSKYNLSLKNVKNAEGVFSVSPTHGEGRTPVVVKVVNSEALDYDVEDHNLRTLIFDLVASVNGKDIASTRITVNLQDANDNSPKFKNSIYNLNVEENSKIGLKITELSATDKDAGIFGKLSYVIKGFGADYFYTNSKDGGVFVKKNLDYELQKSYSLTLVATDGGGRETNTNLFINVIDLNDNNPMFETLEYTRTIREGATEFEPQFFVRATDDDGPTQGGGRISYRIDSENSISGHVFAVDTETGEIKITNPVSSMDTERGQYELIVSATDHGIPPLKNDTRVLIRVGLSGNQRPIFKGHFSSQNNGLIPGPPSYRVNVPENAPPGYNVTTVSATDPDGIDSLLQYRIVGAGDNFFVNERTGVITVSPYSRLDRDTNPDHYTIVVNAVDAGIPIPETATATVFIKIQDVNDKPPKFTKSSYTAYVSERTPINTQVLTVSATDTDLDSKLRYSIIEPIRASSKTGIQLISSATYNYKSAFKINETTGQIIVNNTLDYNSVAVVTITVKAEDLNAHFNKEKQFVTTEVTLYIQSFKDTNPIFQHRGWTGASPIINVRVKEETQIGLPIFKLTAEDPVTEQLIHSFELVTPDSFGFVDINDLTGDVILKKRLDYEALNSTNFQFSVKAKSVDGTRQTVTYVNVTVENVNDNDPIFDKKEYRVTVLESIKYPEKILNVNAKDNDSVLTDLDKRFGYNSISYSLSGQFANYFVINNVTGLIQIAPNQTLDREKQSVLKFIVIAEDSTGKPTESRKTTAEIIIDVLDVNDNAPTFAQKSYTAVIPENAPINTFVANISAIDPDEGPGGEIKYDFLTEGESNGLLKINPATGEIRTKIPLTGKGRSEPYELVVRGQDNGGQVPKQESLQSDVSFTLYIGDVSSNDGIPFFISPKIGQIANISENATIGSPVFQIIASDPDNPATPSGQLSYRIQEDIIDAKVFRIDSKTGVITTLMSLDRETKSSYNIIVEVSDHGQPPQAATFILHINVLDIDDHKPRFAREVDATPIEVLALEEQEIGTIISNFTAIDEDIGENGAIDYMFVDGNEMDIFKITRTVLNHAIITNLQKLDRETAESYTLTIKCFKYKTKHTLISRKTYNAFDLSEIKIIIKVVDIDDHLPEFEIINPTIGIRLNVPIDTQILTSKAFDVDSNALPINLSIQNIDFIPQFHLKEKLIQNYTSLFTIDSSSGEVKTAKILSDFVDGYFELIIRANNSNLPNRYKNNIVKVYIIRDRSLLRFVFSKTAAEVTGIIEDFKKKIQQELNSSDLNLHVFNTQVLVKPDHSLDFSSSSSCFQIYRHGAVLSPNEMQKIMDSNEIKSALIETYIKYSVSQVDSCSVKRNLASNSFIASTGTWLVILSGLIGIAAFVSTMTACYLSRKYKKQVRRLLPVRVLPEPYGTSSPVLYAEPIYGPM